MTGSGVRIPLAAPGARVGFGLVPSSKGLPRYFRKVYTAPALSTENLSGFGGIFCGVQSTMNIRNHNPPAKNSKCFLTAAMFDQAEVGMFRWPMHLFRSNDFSDVIRRMRPILLLALLTVGALAALAVRERYLVTFQTRVSLPMSGDLATFREAEPLFSSAELLAKYGAKRNILADPDFQTIQEQFARHRNSPIHIEHAFRLSRKDVRDLPDSYSAKEDIGRRIGFEGIQSDVEVYASAADPESAIRLSKLALGYVRDSLAAASIASLMRRWGQGSRTDLAVNRETTAKLRSDLASIDRRLET